MGIFYTCLLSFWNIMTILSIVLYGIFCDHNTDSGFWSSMLVLWFLWENVWKSELFSVAVAESIFLCHKEKFNTFSLRLVKTKETWLFETVIFIKRMEYWCLRCAHGWTVFILNLSPQTTLPFSVMETYSLCIHRLHVEFVWRTQDWNIRNLQCLHLEADVLMDQKTV